MIENHNKILARISYSHVPKRCRKSRANSLRIYDDTKEEARKELYIQAKAVFNDSKKVLFSRTITYQPAKISYEDGYNIKEFSLYAIPGRDGCESESFDINIF